jgi:hypothetical protein
LGDAVDNDEDLMLDVVSSIPDIQEEDLDGEGNDDELDDDDDEYERRLFLLFDLCLRLDFDFDLDFDRDLRFDFCSDASVSVCAFSTGFSLSAFFLAI